MPAAAREQAGVLTAFEAGVRAVCQLAAAFDDASWAALTPCGQWRAADVAGHLRCVADDYHEYLDDAPASRYARLMATGAHRDTLVRKLTRQNAAELAALADAPPAHHVGVFAAGAREYAARVAPVWDLPHHQYRDVVVTVGGMAGAACAEWHLHAYDLAAALGTGYRPADPQVVLAGWLAGQPHLPPPPPAGRLGALAGRRADPWHAVLAASGRVPAAGSAGTGGPAGAARGRRRHLVRPWRKGTTAHAARCGGGAGAVPGAF